MLQYIQSLALSALQLFNLASKVQDTKNVDAHVKHSNYTDPNDQSWMTKWAAVGDSYAAGIGAGERVSYWCSRYNLAYPNFIAMDERMGVNANRSFLFRACSGATTLDVKNQLWWLTDGTFDAITISAGGNDVGLSNVLNDCIFGWSPESATVCEETLARTQSLIDALPENLDGVLDVAKPKLTASGRIYQTGYARFFEDTTRQCDNVTFAYWSFTNSTHQNLTRRRRRTYNDLVMQVNAQISQAAIRAGTQVVYVEIDSYFSQYGGRFCESEVMEPDANRDPLLFFQEYTERVTVRGNDDLPEQDPRFADAVPASSWEGRIAAMIYEAQEADRRYRDEMGADAIYMIDGSTAKDLEDEESDMATRPPITAQSGISYWISDEVKWVFHPRPNGHALIANRVLEEMMLQRAKMLGMDTEPEDWYSCPFSLEPHDKQSFVLQDVG